MNGYYFNDEEIGMNDKMKVGFAIRGLMLDPARLTERHEFYFELLPRLARWGYNTLWWHFCDDEGCALKLDSHPEFATPYAFGKPEMRRLIAAARDAGIEIVPEVESLGHALFITRLPQYAHLFNGHPYGHNAICPSHPQTLGLVKEIIEEVAELFDGPYLHAGLDEADLGKCPRCRRRGQGRPAWWVYAGHAKALHRIVTGCGKKMIIWADAIERHPALLRVLPRDIVLAHWHYGEVPVEKIMPSINAGFQVVCVPALCGPLVLPGATNLQNVDDMIKVAGRLPKKNCLGVVTSWWESFRVLRDACMFALAYAGHAQASSRPIKRTAFSRSFIKAYFKLDDKSVAAALWRLHSLVSRERFMLKLLYPDSFYDLYQVLKTFTVADLAVQGEQFWECVDALRKGRAKVRDNLASYDAFLLAGRIMATAFDNGCKLLQAFEKYTWAVNLQEQNAPHAMRAKALSAAVKALDGMPEAIAELSAAAGREWDRTRYPRDPKKDNRSPLIRQRGWRAILPILMRSADFCRLWHERLRSEIRLTSGR